MGVLTFFGLLAILLRTKLAVFASLNLGVLTFFGFLAILLRTKLAVFSSPNLKSQK